MIPIRFESDILTSPLIKEHLDIMEQSEKDVGIIAALMTRFEKNRLPRTERLLEKVNGGEKLSDAEIVTKGLENEKTS